MADLRLVGVSEDGLHLVLADESGDQHQVAIDERIRAAVNGHLSRLGQLTMALESRISPREIQERVRAGESAEHVAATAGVPVERVLRFVGPVLREREHIAERAQRARLATAGTSGPSSLLYDVVERAAVRKGVEAEALRWDSARREDHSWLVTVTWPDATIATWALDLLRHQATPIDSFARKISGADEPAAPQPAPDDEPDGESAANVRRFVPRAVSQEPVLELDLTATGEPDDGDSDSDDDFDQYDSESDSDENDTVVLHTDGGSDADPRAREAADDSSAQPVEPAEAAEPAAPSRASAGRSRRARVPKWDDIMFGMKPKD